MKYVLFSIIGIVLVVGVCGIFSRGRSEEVALTVKPKGKVLIVYYSQSGNKNTEVVAKWIHNAVGGDLHAIEMEHPYRQNYRDVLKESKRDIDNKNNPAIKPFTKNIADYDTIFIGSPIWYGSYAPPVVTFLTGISLKGKTVIPFCTHGGDGAGHFYNNIESAVKGAKVLSPGFTAEGSNQVERFFRYGTKNKASQNDVNAWLNEILK